MTPEAQRAARERAKRALEMGRMSPTSGTGGLARNGSFERSDACFDWSRGSCARARSDEDGRARAGGTPLYAPPEVCSGEGRACSTAGDMWGLGCVMYQLAAGAPPFDGGDKETLRRNIVETEPPALEGEFAGEYDDVVRALLFEEPSRASFRGG